MDDNDKKEAPVAQPSDYAPETSEVYTQQEDTLGAADVGYVNQAGEYPTAPSTEQLRPYYETSDGQISLRNGCLDHAVRSLGPEREDSGADWADDTIRRAERFRKYILNGVTE